MKEKPRAKHQSKAWFIRVRGSYLPATKEGWLTYIPFVGYLLLALIAGLRYAGSAAFATAYIAINWIAATIAMTLFAQQRSKNTKS